MNSRRSILKLIGMAPAAAGSAASQLAPMLSSPAVAAAAALGANAAQTIGIPGPSYGVLGPIIGKQLQLLKREAEDEMYARRSVRAGGLDADLSSMRSTSRAWKEAKQHERDMADSRLLRHTDSVMWGN